MVVELVVVSMKSWSAGMDERESSSWSSWAAAEVGWEDGRVEDDEEAEDAW